MDRAIKIKLLKWSVLSQGRIRVPIDVLFVCIILCQTHSTSNFVSQNQRTCTFNLVPSTEGRGKGTPGIYCYTSSNHYILIVYQVWQSVTAGLVR